MLVPMPGSASRPEQGSAQGSVGQPSVDPPDSDQLVHDADHLVHDADQLVQNSAHVASVSQRVADAAHVRRVPLATILTTVGVVVLTGFAILLLWVLRIEVLYVLVGTFAGVALTPAVRFLERHGASHGLAVTIVFLVGLLAAGGLVYLFAAPLISAVTRFAHELPSLIQQAEHGRGSIGRLLKRFHLQAWANQNAPKLASDITKLVKPAQALSVGAAAASTVLAVATIAVLSFFIMLEGPRVWRGGLSLLPPDRSLRVQRVFDEVTRSVAGYVLGNVFTSVIAGVVVFVTLALLGVPFPLLFGIWVAFVDLLPLVGGLLAGVPTVIVALLHSPVAGIVTLIVFLAYQQIENHVLNPVVMSRTVRMNPLWVLMSVLVGAKLGAQVGSAFGSFVGALLGIPIGGAIQVIAREIRQNPMTETAAAEGALPSALPGEDVDVS
jgi:predicted PurR-regulated permease PerM